jgi:hypothetical protein
MTAAAVAMAVELLHFTPESKRAHDMFMGLIEGSRSQGVQVRPTSVYRGESPWLMLWGPGDPVRASVMARHVAGGGHAICFDLAYWDREKKVRLSIDAAHPAAWVMRQDCPRERFIADRVPVSDKWKATGPVLIAGIGDKARVQYGAQTVDRWEAEMLRACQERWPGRPVLYRKKKAWSPVPADAQIAPLRPIDEALNGVSLLVTWHSNVAVDAIRNGIPVVCMDGAAAAVCPSVLGVDDPQPLPADVRDRFLGNLAWFQWAPHESRQCWRFLQGMLA